MTDLLRIRGREVDLDRLDTRVKVYWAARERRKKYPTSRLAVADEARAVVRIIETVGRRYAAGGPAREVSVRSEPGGEG